MGRQAFLREEKKIPPVACSWCYIPMLGRGEEIVIIIIIGLFLVPEMAELYKYEIGIVLHLGLYLYCLSSFIIPSMYKP